MDFGFLGAGIWIPGLQKAQDSSRLHPVQYDDDDLDSEGRVTADFVADCTLGWTGFDLTN